MKIPESKETKLKWLVVGGAPRSGTTHMGLCLNQSKDIALFHEYASHHFFSAVDALFTETERMQQLTELNDFDSQDFLNYLPSRAAHLKDIVQFIFQRVFNKNARFIGTKFPGYQVWPLPCYPDWISPRYIHITRNPFDSILSLILKDYKVDELKPSDVDDLLFYWISAWNYAVEHIDNESFFHVFYDNLLTNSANVEKQMSIFLDGLDDFSLSSFHSTHSASCYERFCHAKLETYFSFISYIAPQDKWIDFATQRLNKHQRIGFPYHWGREIGLSVDSDGWRYVSGFYPPEVDGSWTKSYLSEILFAPTTPCGDDIQIYFEVSWVVMIENRPVEFDMVLNGSHIFHGMIKKDSSNEQLSFYSIYVPSFYCEQFDSISLKFQIKNPINPCKEGLSDDDRDLAFMIRSVRFEKM